MAKRSVKIVGHSIIALFFLVVIILGLELFFRSHPSFGRAGMAYDENLLYRLTPNMTAKKQYAWGQVGKPAFSLSINKQGFRGPDFSTIKPEHKKRILIIGDSYTAGLDYPDDQIFSSYLEQGLTELGLAVEILNASCPAWGTDQQYLYWQLEGKSLQPDLLIFIFSPNDMREMYNKGLVSLNDQGEIEIKKAILPAKEIKGWQWATYSSLYKYLQKQLWLTKYGSILNTFHTYPVNYGIADSTDWDLPLYLEASFPQMEASYQLYNRLMATVRDDCKTMGTKLLVAKLPIKYEYDGSYEQPGLSPKVVETRLDSSLASLSIPFLNLNNALDQKENPLDIFMDWEYHFDQEGHLFVAKVLEQYLLDQEWFH